MALKDQACVSRSEAPSWPDRGLQAGAGRGRREAREAQAGFAAGDEWVGLEVGARGQLGHWRVNKLDDVPVLLGKERKALALVSRDKQLLRLPLVVPQQSTVWRLEAPAGRTPGWPGL